MTWSERMGCLICGGKRAWVSGKSQSDEHRRKAAPDFLSIVVISDIATSISAFADVQSVRRDKAFAQANCSQCHSIDRATRSPRITAPPFRTLHKRYPVETLEYAGAGIYVLIGAVAGHAAE